MCSSKVSTTESCTRRLREHLLAHLVCPGRHTITSLITTNGKQFQDWSSDYELYSEKRVHPQMLFDQVRQQVEHLQGDNTPLCVAIDDTILRKTGKKIAGTAYRRDPLGPPFNVNLVWAQRMLQFSAAVTSDKADARMIPIAFEDASSPKKPKKGASEEQFEGYRELLKQRNLNQVAINALDTMQNKRRDQNGHIKPVHVLIDGSYTNRKFLRHLPENTTAIGRIRKDAKLFDLPQNNTGCGRKRVYGKELKTPEQIRQDESVPWQTINVRACGKDHQIRIKKVGPVRWRATGKINLQLLVIAPIAYRKNHTGKILYRNPAYLICTDADMSAEQIVQEYIWRWDIEVNHRDEKTILGVGQAQVRNEHSVHNVPACSVASYAMLLLAAIKAYGWNSKPNTIPKPKWRKKHKDIRASTLDLINELRRELWSHAIKENQLTDFMSQRSYQPKSVFHRPNLVSSLLAQTA